MSMLLRQALIDMLPRERPAGEAPLPPMPGGAGFNTAIAFWALGVHRFSSFSGLPSDLFGEQLRTVLGGQQRSDSSPSPYL